MFLQFLERNAMSLVLGNFMEEATAIWDKLSRIALFLPLNVSAKHSRLIMPAK